VTGLEWVGAIAGPLSLALAGAVVYLALRVRGDARHSLGAVIAAGTRELEAERRAFNAEAAGAAARADLAQVRQALAEEQAKAAPQLAARRALDAEVARLLEELDACSGPVAVRNRLARFLSMPRS
jgi:ATPase subunit of ABC transporter with duplicated ATPase domains